MITIQTIKGRTALTEISEFQKFSMLYRPSKRPKQHIPETSISRVFRLLPGALIGRKCFCGKPFWRILFLNEC